VRESSLRIGKDGSSEGNGQKGRATLAGKAWEGGISQLGRNRRISRKKTYSAVRGPLLFLKKKRNRKKGEKRSLCFYRTGSGRGGKKIKREGEVSKGKGILFCLLEVSSSRAKKIRGSTGEKRG